MSKYIYFVEGYLTNEEKPYADIYYKEIRSIYKAEAKGYILKLSVWPKDYELARERSCTRERFEAIWEDPDTAGIILYSHGDQHGRSWLIGDIGEPRRVILDPRKLPKSGANLRGLTVLGCYSNVMERFWRQKIRHSRPAISTEAGLLQDGSLDFTDETLNWIRRRGGSYERPEVGSRSFLQYVMGQLEPKGQGGGCSCDFASVSRTRAQRVQGRIIARSEQFQTERSYVPFLRIPKVGTDASHFTMHKVRFGDRVRYLAEDYGYRDRGRFVADVQRLNPGIDFRRLQPGQSIRVPTKVGVPRHLSTPWALRRTAARQIRPTSAAATGAAPSTLDLLKAQLARTRSSRPQPRPLTTNVMDTIEHLEQQAASREASDRWLQRLRQQYGSAKPIGQATAGAQERGSFLRKLGDRLHHTAGPSGGAGDFHGTTIDRIRALERDATARESTQRWLTRIARQYGAPTHQSGTVANRGTTLGRLGQLLERTPTRTFADRATFSSGGGTLSNLGQFSRPVDRIGGGEHWLKRAQRQLR